MTAAWSAERVRRPVVALGGIAVLYLAGLLTGCGNESRPTPTEEKAAAVPVLTWERVRREPFPRTAFTQGLLLRAGKLWLSTGQYGESTVQEIDLASGEVLQRLDLPETVFGEGLAMLGDTLYQLTWQNQICYLYQAQPLKLTGRFSYEGEGWGLASNGQELAMSNGSAQIAMRDPETFEVTRRLSVRGPSGTVTRLNELEFVGGLLLANVWHQDRVVVIDSDNGRVLAELDFRALTEEAVGPRAGERVLNGLAWDAAGQQLWVAGKEWPWIYAVRVDWGELAARGSGLPVVAPDGQ
ncbi:MAG: glutaminyl-peptide cyclotransferase [Verrucomicrobiota bacterium]